jgi:hypothetical protein
MNRRIVEDILELISLLRALVNLFEAGCHHQRERERERNREREKQRESERDIAWL